MGWCTKYNYHTKQYFKLRLHDVSPTCLIQVRLLAISRKIWFKKYQNRINQTRIRSEGLQVAGGSVQVLQESVDIFLKRYIGTCLIWWPFRYFWISIIFHNVGLNFIDTQIRFEQLPSRDDHLHEYNNYIDQLSSRLTRRRRRLTSNVFHVEDQFSDRYVDVHNNIYMCVCR